MISKEQIQEQIDKLTAEEFSLRATHEAMVREHQQRTAVVQETAQNNANRIQQITGAISQLRTLLNGQNGQNPERKPPP
jgi:uncharacterized protein YbcI